MGDATVLETDVFNGEAGHAAKHNDVNTQVNYLTALLTAAGRLSPSSLDTMAAGVVARDAYVTPAIQAMLQRIKTGIQDVFWTHVGDSIDASGTLWVAQLSTWLGTQFPTHTVKFRIWDTGTNAYGGWSTLQTGTGARTLWVSNGAVAGSSTPYAASRMGAMVWATTPDLLTYAYNANEFPHTALGGDLFAARMLTFTEDALRGCNAQIVYVAKPPRPANPGGVEYRNDAARAVCRTKGFGFIDFMQPFLDTPNYVSALYIDPATEPTIVHPNAAGQALMLSIAKRHFTYRPGVSGSEQQPSSLLAPAHSLVANGFFTDWTGSDPANWLFNSNATCTKDTAHFETGTYGLKIEPANTAVASASLGIDVPATLLRGQYVTALTRVLAPWSASGGAAGGLGRIGLTDGVNAATQQASAEVDPAAGFQWRAVTLRVGTAATNLRVALEGRVTFTGAGHWATFDRVVLVRGTLPRDSIAGLVA